MSRLLICVCLSLVIFGVSSAKILAVTQQTYCVYCDGKCVMLAPGEVQPRCTDTSGNCSYDVMMQRCVLESGDTEIQLTSTPTPKIPVPPIQTPTQVPSPTAAATLNCGYCGSNCINILPGMMCPMVMPPLGNRCIAEAGKCVEVPDDGVALCKWCGVQCVRNDYKGQCTMDMPPVDTECVYLNNACTQVPITPPVSCGKKQLGDADCNNKIELNDFVIWVKEFRGTETTKNADFDNSDKVDLSDFVTWIKGYKGETQ